MVVVVEVVVVVVVVVEVVVVVVEVVVVVVEVVVVVVEVVVVVVVEVVVVVVEVVVVVVVEVVVVVVGGGHVVLILRTDSQLNVIIPSAVRPVTRPVIGQKSVKFKQICFPLLNVTKICTPGTNFLNFLHKDIIITSLVL
ncbi:hypothetical protein [Priestia sp. YIM B13489]|uniref:hypothetical protein n=2 Tax=Priestia sp. YIM B13489 TaxID=3366313 RepID=UPI00367340CE